MMRPPPGIAGIAVAGLLLAGCGQRGALYLPDKQDDVKVAPASSATASPAPGQPQASPVPAQEPAAEDPERRNNGTPRTN